MLAPSLIPLALIRSGARWADIASLIPLALIRSGARWADIASLIPPGRSSRKCACVGVLPRRRGQSMVETVLAVLFVTFLFLVLFQLSHLVTGKILLDHAAARAARARAVGFNEFMCLKSARIAMIPVAGERTWPGDVTFASADSRTAWEVGRTATYMSTLTESLARGVLDYERWDGMKTKVESEAGLAPKVTSSVEIGMPRFFRWGLCPNGDVRVKGESEIESHFPFYMEDQGR